MVSDQKSNEIDPGDPNEKTPYYIQAASSHDDRSRVLKHGDTFAVFDHFGDIKSEGLGEEGLYHNGTRFLSFSLLLLGRDRPLFLSSTIKEDNDLLAVDLTNPDIGSNDTIRVPRGTLHISRIKLLWQGACHERVIVKNYGLEPVSVSLGIHFAADFVDIFEVRGMHRDRRGSYLETQVTENQVLLAYRGLDNETRRTRIIVSPKPEALSATAAQFRISLAPQRNETIYLTTTCETDGEHGRQLPFDEAMNSAKGAFHHSQGDGCVISTPNELFNQWVSRATADLHMMTTDTPFGLYPYAGIPWFSAVRARWHSHRVRVPLVQSQLGTRGVDVSRGNPGDREQSRTGRGTRQNPP